MPEISRGGYSMMVFRARQREGDPAGATRTGVMPVVAAAGLICILVYLRALSCGFVNYDDPDYVLNNPLIRNLDAKLLTEAFGQAHVGWWMPLTWISLAVDYHFWGLNPLGYHLTNIVLHGANTGLVVLIADRLLRGGSDTGKWLPETGGWGYLLALLAGGLWWGLHPLRVESVAWVTERKDVLNGLFSLGAILGYLRYAEARQNGERGGGAYGLSLVLFTFSLMAKSVSVVLPLMLLVADWYPLGRLRRDTLGPVLKEKLPFLALSAAMAVVTIHFTAQSKYLVSYEMFPFWQRLVVSGAAIVEYCRLLLAPVGISPLHMIPDPLPVAYTVKAVAAAFICAGVYLGRRWYWLPAVWLTFLLPLLPVLAFFQNGDQAYAARFTYLPSLGPSLAAAGLLAWGYGRFSRRGRWLMLSAVAALLLWYAGMTARLIAVWDTPETMWTRVIDVEPSAQAYKERGDHYYATGNHGAAVADFSQAIRLVTSVWRPYVYNLYAYRGEALRAAGRHEEAVRDFTEAIRLSPHPSYFYFRGRSLQALGRSRDAAEDFRRAGATFGTIGWHWDAIQVYR